MKTLKAFIGVVKTGRDEKTESTRKKKPTVLPRWVSSLLSLKLGYPSAESEGVANAQIEQSHGSVVTTSCSCTCEVLACLLSNVAVDE